MGSQSSSGMSGGRGSSSSNPSDQPEEEENPSNQDENPFNQGSRGSSSSHPSDQPEEENPSTQGRGRRTADRQTTSEEDVDLAEVLAYLLRRWGGVGSMLRFTSPVEEMRDKIVVSTQSFMLTLMRFY